VTSKRLVVIPVVIALAIGLFAVLQFSQGENPGSIATTTVETSTTQTEQTKTVEEKLIQVTVTTSTVAGGNVLKYVVSPSEILSGGPPKDGIPSIDNPVFISAEQAERFLSDNDLVIGLEYKGVVRAYPYKVLVWHEIVNDVVAGDHLAITYCPLCGTSTAFVAVLEGEPVQFGVSGKLYNSDLVMYDRRTDTWWSQHWGIGILGPLAGQVLKRVQVDVMTWAKWKSLHPDTEVLSTETGHSRPYGRDPYGNYYGSTEIWFPVKNKDDRLHPKTIVHGINIGGSVKVYEEKSIAKAQLLNDEFAGEPLLVLSPFEQLVRVYSRNLDGQVLEFELRDGRFFDKQTGSEWNIGGQAVEGPLKGKSLKPVLSCVGFWFAWVAFFPDLELYSENA